MTLSTPSREPARSIGSAVLGSIQTLANDCRRPSGKGLVKVTWTAPFSSGRLMALTASPGFATRALPRHRSQVRAAER